MKNRTLDDKNYSAFIFKKWFFLIKFHLHFDWVSPKQFLKVKEKKKVVL